MGPNLPPVIFVKTFCGFDLFEGSVITLLAPHLNPLVCGYNGQRNNLRCYLLLIQYSPMFGNILLNG